MPHLRIVRPSERTRVLRRLGLAGLTREEMKEMLKEQNLSVLSHRSETHKTWDPTTKKPLNNC